jgi:hypothetical protein
MSGSCVHGNGTSISIKDKERYNQVTEYPVLKNDFFFN